MKIHVYQFSRNSLKFHILTKILILISIIGNEIDQLLFYKLMAGACTENGVNTKLGFLNLSI